MTTPLSLSGSDLSLADLVEVADLGRSASLSSEAAVRVDRARAVIDRAVREDRVVYGVTTGFGKFSDVVIPRDKLSELQTNLIRSHAAAISVISTPVDTSIRGSHGVSMMPMAGSNVP